MLSAQSTALTVGLTLAGFAMPVAAEAPPDAPEPEIVVRGQQELALRNFVESMADPGLTRQLARWGAEICPTVIGIDPPQAEFMQRRIGEVAASLHIRARTGGCLTTMLIVFTPDAAGLAASFARHYPITLRADGQWKLDRFVASTLPVRWLTVTDPCGIEGCSLPNSRLTMATHPAFQTMVVIADAQQIGRFSLGELADYLSIVLLGNPPLSGHRPSTSILSMFEIQRTPGLRFELTTYDHSFLEGLYRSRAEGSGQEQRASIVHHMRNDAQRNP